MTKWLCGGLLLLWPWGATAQEPPPGAKEAFFDQTETVVSGLAVPAPRPKPGARERDPLAGATPARAGAERTVSNQAGPGSPIRVGLRYWVELLRTDPRNPGLPVPPDQRFRSGDRVRLHFESNVPGYIAVFQIGSSGAASMLYPATDQGLADNRMPAHESRAVPEGAAWFRFDERPGVENLLVVFAAEPSQIEELKLASRIDPTATARLIDKGHASRGGKDLVLETERDVLSEVGVFAVNLAGEAIIMPIALQHD